MFLLACVALPGWGKKGSNEQILPYAEASPSALCVCFFRENDLAVDVFLPLLNQLISPESLPKGCEVRRACGGEQQIWEW